MWRMKTKLISKSNNSYLPLRMVAGYCLAFCCFLLPASVFAQADIHFSQFYETSTLRNPALTGVFEDDYKVGAYCRSQWSSITHPYTTGMISAETHVEANQNSDDFFSFGLLGYADKAGSIDQKITGFYPAFSYNKSINPNNNTYLSVGFTGGYVQYSFDPLKTTFNNQYQNGNYNAANPSMETLPNAKMTLLDAGAGVNFNTSRGENNNITYVIGFSGYHFTQPKMSYYQKPGITQNIRWNGNAAVSAFVNDHISYQVQANYASQGTYQEIMAGGMVHWTQVATKVTTTFIISGGLYYRYKDALIPIVKVKYQNMALGVSYDVNVSSLKTASLMQGGYEVTLFYSGNYTDKGETRKTVCPKF